MNKFVNGMNFLSFNNNKIVVILDDNDEPWFYGTQISKILGYKNICLAIFNNIKQKYTKTSSEIQELCSIVSIPKNIPNALKFINEAGVQQLILKSNSAIVNQFQEWLYDIVILPLKKYKQNKTNLLMADILDLNKKIYFQLQKEIELNDEIYKMFLENNNTLK